MKEQGPEGDVAWGPTAGQPHRQPVSPVPRLRLFPVTRPGLLSHLPWADLPPPCTPLTLPVTSARRRGGMGSWQRSPPALGGRKSLSVPALASWPGPLSSKPQPGNGYSGPRWHSWPSLAKRPQLVKAGIGGERVGVFTGISLLPSSPRLPRLPHLSCDGGREGGEGLARRQRAARVG